MSLTLVAEMIRTETKQLAIAKRELSSGTSSPKNGLFFDGLPDLSKNSRGNSTASLNEIVNLTSFSNDNYDFTTNNKIKSASRQETPDTLCMNLFGDLQDSLQQLGLLVEMGLVLGKITSGMALLSDGTYDSILCDILKIFAKVQSLTQRLGRSQNVLWTIDRSKLSKGKNYSHPDVLLFVLISCLTQILPHADLIKVKGSFVPVDELNQVVDDEATIRSVAAVIELVAPPVVIGHVGILLTELEVYGDPSNLKEIISKLNNSSDGSESSFRTSSSSENSDHLPDPSEFVNLTVEDFGGSIFSLGTLLENVLGGSSYIMTNHGCTFSFSIPCRVEVDPLMSLVEMPEDFKREPKISFVEEPSVKIIDAQMPSTNAFPYTVKNNNNVKNVQMDDFVVYVKEPAVVLPPTPGEDNPVVILNVPSIAPSSHNNNNYSSSSSKNEGAQSSQRNSSLNLRELIATDLPAYKRSISVLLVDDSVTVQKVMSIWLNKKNCVVTNALNGLAALNALKVKAYDIVFMDFLMPVMDGITCLKEVQRWMALNKGSVPGGFEDQWVIGMSATALKQDQDMAFEAGMQIFCSKPVDMAAIGYIIEAKRMGIAFNTLRNIVRGNRHSQMTAKEQDQMVEMMLPETESMPLERLQYDRIDMKVSIESNCNTNLFGALQFN